MTALQQRIAAYLREHGPTTQDKLSDMFVTTPRDRFLNALSDGRNERWQLFDGKWALLQSREQ